MTFSLVCLDVFFLTFLKDRNQPVERNELDNATLYIFANNPAFSAYDGETPDLQTLLDKTTQVQGIGFCKVGNVECFPMMGSYEVLPEDANDVLEIPLSALFAKIVMDIKVQPNEVIAGKEPPHFILKGYEVHNVANKVVFDGNKDIDEELYVHDEVYSAPITGNNVAQGTSNIEFSFFLPERFLTPHTAASDYNYPFKVDGKVRSEDSIYCQRFKPCLVQQVGEEGQVGYKADKKATFVRFSGEYVDHQNHNYEVTYDIYLGNDNYSNFDIERNTQYNNKITIKGVESSKDQEGSTISIDHRVGVERTQPAIISLRRETLLDSHFEVRPLRFKPTGQGSDVNINAVKVEVLNPGTTNWMRLERSFGDGTKLTGENSIYITTVGASCGKRKYFTYNLVNGKSLDGTTLDTSGSSLVNSTEVVVPLTGETDKCVWIYIDENTATGDDVRSGAVKVTYGNLTSGTFAPTADPEFPAVEYVFNQRNLFNVTYGSRNYNIEYYEEYLHNFDSDEEFNKTEYEGMKWGLDGAQLSFTKDTILISKGSWADVNTSVKSALKNSYNPKYDFYLTRDILESQWAFEDDEYNDLVHEYNGYTFFNDIISDLKNSELDTKIDEVINILNLGQKPNSAIEYCYNKNKRNIDGTVANVVWYLPAIDEIEEIVMSKYGSNLEYYSYSRFVDFQAKAYWSCQPSYLNNYIFVERSFFGVGDRYGHYMIDDVNRARATSVLYQDKTGNGPNDPQNYSKVSSESSGFEYYIDADYEYEKFLGMEVAGTGKLKNTTRHLVPAEGIRFVGSNQSDSWDTTIYPSSPAKGNKLRTDMARVRCVRKQ